MRIHSDILNRTLIKAAALDLDGVHIDFTDRGSRSRARAFDLHVTADKRKGRRWRNTGNHGAATGEAAATWDEWGIVLGRLFDLDPDAVVPETYLSGEHFHWSTGNRFDTDRRETMQRHDQHRWEYQGTSAGRVYEIHECRDDDCDAVTRRVAHGRTWDEIAGAGL